MDVDQSAFHEGPAIPLPSSTDHALFSYDANQDLQLNYCAQTGEWSVHNSSARRVSLYDRHDRPPQTRYECLALHRSPAPHASTHGGTGPHSTSSANLQPPRTSYPTSGSSTDPTKGFARNMVINNTLRIAFKGDPDIVPRLCDQLYHLLSDAPIELDFLCDWAVAHREHENVHALAAFQYENEQVAAAFMQDFQLANRFNAHATNWHSSPEAYGTWCGDRGGAPTDGHASPSAPDVNCELVTHASVGSSATRKSAAEGKREAVYGWTSMSAVFTVASTAPLQFHYEEPSDGERFGTVSKPPVGSTGVPNQAAIHAKNHMDSAKVAHVLVFTQLFFQVLELQSPNLIGISPPYSRRPPPMPSTSADQPLAPSFLSTLVALSRVPADDEYEQRKRNDPTPPMRTYPGSTRGNPGPRDHPPGAGGAGNPPPPPPTVPRRAPPRTASQRHAHGLTIDVPMANEQVDAQRPLTQPDLELDSSYGPKMVDNLALARVLSQALFATIADFPAYQAFLERQNEYSVVGRNASQTRSSETRSSSQSLVVARSINDVNKLVKDGQMAIRIGPQLSQGQHWSTYHGVMYGYDNAEEQQPSAPLSGQSLASRRSRGMVTDSDSEEDCSLDTPATQYARLPPTSQLPTPQASPVRSAQQVVVKFTVVEEGEESEDRLRSICVEQALFNGRGSHLQGSVLPRHYGTFVDDQQFVKRFICVQELVGPRIIAGDANMLDPLSWSAVRSLVGKLHQAGIAHNDLVIRHVRWADGSPMCSRGFNRHMRLIDLGRASLDVSRDLDREKDMLDRIEICAD